MATQLHLYKALHTKAESCDVHGRLHCPVCRLWLRLRAIAGFGA